MESLECLAAIHPASLTPAWSAVVPAHDRLWPSSPARCGRWSPVPCSNSPRESCPRLAIALEGPKAGHSPPSSHLPISRIADGALCTCLYSVPWSMNGYWYETQRTGQTLLAGASRSCGGCVATKHPLEQWNLGSLAPSFVDSFSSIVPTLSWGWFQPHLLVLHRSKYCIFFAFHLSQSLGASHFHETAKRGWMMRTLLTHRIKTPRAAPVRLLHPFLRKSFPSCPASKPSLLAACYDFSDQDEFADVELLLQDRMIVMLFLAWLMANEKSSSPKFTMHSRRTSASHRDRYRSAHICLGFAQQIVTAHHEWRPVVPF